MPITANKCLYLRQRPAWDVDGGRWFVQQGEKKSNEPSKMYRGKPSIHVICSPLFGTATAYPTLTRRHELYREGIEVLLVFQDHAEHRTDLFTLAIYRRQVTSRGGITLDPLFFEIALRMQPALTSEEWESLAQRMPECAPIKRACLDQACL
jgi:hypothetical protein